MTRLARFCSAPVFAGCAYCAVQIKWQNDRTSLPSSTAQCVDVTAFALTFKPPYFPFTLPAILITKGALLLFRPVFASRPEPTSGEGLANQISREEQEPEQPLSLVAIQGDFKRDNHGRRNGKRGGGELHRRRQKTCCHPVLRNTYVSLWSFSIPW